MSTSISDGAQVQKTSRIISHMNAAHQSSLSHYLRHTHQLSSFAASRNPTLIAILPRYLTITIDTPWPLALWAGFRRKSSAHQYHVPLDPPLAEDLSDIRPRLIALDADAREHLGIDDVIIERYTAPESLLETITFYMVCLTFLAFSVPQSLFEGFAQYLAPSGGWFVTFFITVRPWVWWLIVVVHGTETVYFERGAMRRHGVAVGSGGWWKWVGSCLAEGVGAQWRFGRCVERERRRKEGKGQGSGQGQGH